MGHLSNILKEDIQSRGRVRALTSPDAYEVCPIPRSCQEILWIGKIRHKPVSTGLYSIKPSATSVVFKVLCDMNTQGGGWAVVQNRFGGSENFNRSWQDYKRGFGDATGEFWLGLDYIHAITGLEPNELLIKVEDLHNNEGVFKSGEFSIGSEKEGYAIRLIDNHIGKSIAGLAGIKFSTSDNNHGINCVNTTGGGWWFNEDCSGSNLNGKYGEGDSSNGVFWEEFRGKDNRLKITS
nr:unnamed protein product [Callosobruchus analis]